MGERRMTTQYEVVYGIEPHTMQFMTGSEAEWRSIYLSGAFGRYNVSDAFYGDAFDIERRGRVFAAPFYLYRARARALIYRPALLPGFAPAHQRLVSYSAAPGFGLIVDQPPDAADFIYFKIKGHCLTEGSVFEIRENKPAVVCRYGLNLSDAVRAAAEGMRRAGLILPAEQIVAAGEKGADVVIRVLEHHQLKAGEWIAAMRDPGPDQVHPAGNLPWVIACALAVARGEETIPPRPFESRA